MTGYTLQRGRSEIFERVTDSHRGSSAVGKVADCIFFSLSYLVRFSVLKRRLAIIIPLTRCVFPVREGSPYTGRA